MPLIKNILIILSLLLCLAFAPMVMAATEARVALVIGNGSYAGGAALKNPENDAKAVASKLESLGFKVIAGYNLDLSEMTDSVQAFSKLSRKAELAIIYYAATGFRMRQGAAIWCRSGPSWRIWAMSSSKPTQSTTCSRMRGVPTMPA